MFKLHQTQMDSILDEVGNVDKIGVPGVRFDVTNPTGRPGFTFSNFVDYCATYDKGFLHMFSPNHFVETTATPLSVLRRYDVMQYFLSYNEEIGITKFGHAEMVEKLCKSVLQNKPSGSTVVIVTIPNTNEDLTEYIIGNYLGDCLSNNTDAIQYINDIHEDELLVFMPVDVNPENVGKNKATLFSTMMEYGPVRLVEDEYTPTEFVVVTDSLYYFVGNNPTPAKLQDYLAKGIRFIECRQDHEVSSGTPFLNRTESNALLYFPLKDLYLNTSGVEFHNYYVSSRIHKVPLYTINSLKQKISVIVPREETVFPKNTVQQLLYSMYEQHRTQTFFSEKCGYVLLFASTEKGAFDDICLNYDLIVPYGDISTLPYMTSLQVTDNELGRYDGYNSYKYLFVHVSNRHGITKEQIGSLLRVAEAHKFHVVIMQEHPNETAVYNDSKKFFI